MKFKHIIIFSILLLSITTSNALKRKNSLHSKNKSWPCGLLLESWSCLNSTNGNCTWNAKKGKCELLEVNIKENAERINALSCKQRNQADCGFGGFCHWGTKACIRKMCPDIDISVCGQVSTCYISHAGKCVEKN